MLSGFSVTVLCNGNLKKSAIVKCTENIGWVGSLDWNDLECRYRGTVVVANATDNSTSNSTVNGTSRTGLFRHNDQYRTTPSYLFILICFMSFLSYFI